MASVSLAKGIRTPSERVSMAALDTTSNRIASRRLTRTVALLNRSGRQLESASQAAPDHFHRKRLHFFASEIRDLSLPLSPFASRREKGRAR